MKVSVADFKNALTMFEAKIVQSQTTNINKFVMGIALARYGRKADKMIATFVGEDGMVDVDALRADIEAGLEASGGELVLEPDFPNELRQVGLTITKIKFSKQDFEEFFTKTLPSVSPTAIQ